MLIQDALKETGKAVNEQISSYSYAAVDEDGDLCWYYRNSNVNISRVLFEHINHSRFEPYHEVKEIRPEKAGELWKLDGVRFMSCIDGSMYMKSCQPSRSPSTLNEVIHGKGGWSRVDPSVEDKNVERIEIEGVEDFRLCGGGGMLSIYKVNIPDGHVDLLENNPTMKMTLEFQKETS